ncbi:MAG TPA: hypothetical protein VFN76_01070 [Candidatus Limnocylindria bacterium]|nr:hypothetical protein [Candidatus Limnocylindria bacterium]
MRSALALLLLLSACATPTDEAAADCDASWRDVDSVIVQPQEGATQTVSIECIRRIDEKRVRIGFEMPAGPTCYVLSAVDVVEAADAVSFTLRVAANDDPAAGACPEEATRTATEIDLQAAVDDRHLLDGSGG